MGATNRFTPVIFGLELTHGTITRQHIYDGVVLKKKKLSVKVAMSFIHKMGLLARCSSSTTPFNIIT